MLGPQLLAFLPAVTLGGYWIGGIEMLYVTAFVLPAAFAAVGAFSHTPTARDLPRDSVTGLPLREAAVQTIDQLLSEGATRERTTACLAVAVDEFDEQRDRLGSSGGDRILEQVANRLQSAVRDTDFVVRLAGPQFAVALSGVRRADLESLIQLSARVQAEIAEPISLDGARVYVTASVGFCQPDRCTASSGEAFLEAAETALREAGVHGTGTIRAFSPEMRTRAQTQSVLAEELACAIDTDQIVAWFQPQVETATGAVSGAEALARWIHPEQGIIPPADFLPLVESAGLSERLGERMLSQSLAALRNWDCEGLVVPKISVNFSTEELRNPQIVDKIRWELDRFGLAAERLGVEVLETVIASTSNDMVIRNLWALAELGCRIELDDFGTGHAAIGNIRRFAVSRIKIDRSFITRLDSDQDQQNVVLAILNMADRLSLDTLAEGVETIGEQSTLLRLGCHYIQGFVVARPMPANAMSDWLRERRLPSSGRAGRQPEGEPRETASTRAMAGKTA